MTITYIVQCITSITMWRTSYVLLTIRVDQVFSFLVFDQNNTIKIRKQRITLSTFYNHASEHKLNKGV